jgi:hypothetical protein
MKQKTISSIKNKLLKSDKPTLIIHIIDLKCDVEVNPYNYSKEDAKHIEYIVKNLAQNIWIDKTYVNFKGNRWKDAFIYEDKWYDLIRTIIKTDFCRKASLMDKEIIGASILVLALTYLNKMLEKYGYDPEDVDISFESNKKLNIEYLEDTQTDWRF